MPVGLFVSGSGALPEQLEAAQSPCASVAWHAAIARYDLRKGGARGLPGGLALVGRFTVSRPTNASESGRLRAHLILMRWLRDVQALPAVPDLAAGRHNRPLNQLERART